MHAIHATPRMTHCATQVRTISHALRITPHAVASKFGFATFPYIAFQFDPASPQELEGFENSYIVSRAIYLRLMGTLFYFLLPSLSLVYSSPFSLFYLFPSPLSHVTPGLIYLFAFSSLFIQLDGLYGKDGILPVYQKVNEAKMIEEDMRGGERGEEGEEGEEREEGEGNNKK
jgi:hypothetical protein